MGQHRIASARDGQGPGETPDVVRPPRTPAGDFRHPAPGSSKVRSSQQRLVSCTTQKTRRRHGVAEMVGGVIGGRGDSSGWSGRDAGMPLIGRSRLTGLVAGVHRGRGQGAVAWPGPSAVTEAMRLVGACRLEEVWLRGVRTGVRKEICADGPGLRTLGRPEPRTCGFLRVTAEPAGPAADLPVRRRAWKPERAGACV